MSASKQEAPSGSTTGLEAGGMGMIVRALEEVAIIGSGNLGTDVLYNLLHSDVLEPLAMIGIGVLAIAP